MSPSAWHLPGGGRQGGRSGRKPAWRKCCPPCVVDASARGSGRGTTRLGGLCLRRAPQGAEVCGAPPGPEQAGWRRGGEGTPGRPGALTALRPAAWQGVERDLRSQLSGGERGLVEEYVEKVPNPSLKSERGRPGGGRGCGQEGPPAPTLTALPPQPSSPST